jgi:hypothetical protein
MPLIATAVACAWFNCEDARAVSLAVEPFSYTLGAGVGGQNGGSGFGGAWTYSSQVSGSISSASIIAGLAFSDLPVSGNAARLNVISSSSSGFGDTVYLRRKPGAVPAAGQEFWYRYLFHMDANITANSFMAAMDIDDVETFYNYRKFGSYGLSGVGSGRGGMGVDNSVVSGAVGSPSLSDTGTYLLIAKFTGINEAFGVARTGTWWALSAADYDAIKAGGITEAELNAQHRQMATETVLPTVQQPLFFTTSDSYELRGYRPPISNAYQHYDFDEIFAGTSLADLGLPSAPVPEPSSVALLALGFAFLNRRQSRRRRHTRSPA